MYVCMHQNKVTPSSLPIQGQVTKRTTVKWPVLSEVTTVNNNGGTL